jgi:dihydroorotate dehydrogenase electron transfer subunit
LYQELAPIISNQEVLPGIFRLILKSARMAADARPGQFVMISSDYGQERLLRRPISLHSVRQDELHFLFARIGSGTEWLSKRQPGEKLDVLGPAGNGFSLVPDSRNLLLVAGGMGIAPLVYLAESAVQSGQSVRMLAGAKNAQLLLSNDSIPSGVEYITATEDGSHGHKGFVTGPLGMHSSWADQIFICGPQPMYQAIVKNRQALLSQKPVQVSLEVRMGCGMGICYSCTIKTVQGLKQVCKDGPVFNLEDVNWDELK